MNSLTDLNGYSNNLNIDYTDTRVPNVIFDRADPVNQSQSGDEGFPLLSQVGIEIIDVANAATSLPTYTINVLNLSGATVSWASLPDGVTLTNPSTGVYTLSGIDSKTIWDAVKVATINLPANYNGIWTYTSSISYYSQEDGNVTKTWTTAATINDVVFLTTPLEYRYTVDTVSTIANTPQIIDLDADYPGVTWTVTGTPNSTLAIDTFTTTGTGGTFSVNSTTKVFTIVGTRAQVNSRLAGLQLDANSNTVDFIITYAVSNSLNGSTDTAVQPINSYGLLYLSNTSTVYFIEDAVSTDITGAPTITEPDYDGSGTYTYTITPTTTSAVTSLGASGTGGTVSFNDTTKVLTITGTRDQVNDRIANLILITPVDWSSDFALTYGLNTPRDETAVKVQSILCGSNDTEVTNMNVSRSYTANRANQIFATDIPYISDFDVHEGITYTIGFSSSLGQFAFGTSDVPVDSLTFSGTKTQCNAKFNSVRFYPAAGVYSNGTFTYTQIKNGVTQVSQTVSLTGTYATYVNARSFLITSSQTFTPNPADVRYGNWEIALVGGGGGGGSTTGELEGGGGGGEVIQATNITVTNQTYSLTVGAGGQQIGLSTVSTAQHGGDTVAFGYTARGGKGNGWSERSGGASGDGNLGGFSSYVYNSGTPYSSGGGGGGTGDTTYNATFISGISHNTSNLNVGWPIPSTKTYTGISGTNVTGTGTGATFNFSIPGTSDGSAPVTITINNGGSGYNIGDQIKILSSQVGNYASDIVGGFSNNEILITITGIGNLSPNPVGIKGTYIAWEASANSMYGWYGGGGSGGASSSSQTLGRRTKAASGSIGNLISFAAAGKTQSNGYTTDAGTGALNWRETTLLNGSYNRSTAATSVASGSGGGGGGGCNLLGLGTSGGSGVIGIRITSKG